MEGTWSAGAGRSWRRELGELPGGVPVGPRGRCHSLQGLSGCDGPGHLGLKAGPPCLGAMAKVFLDHAQCLPPLGPMTASEAIESLGVSRTQTLDLALPLSRRATLGQLRACVSLCLMQGLLEWSRNDTKQHTNLHRLPQVLLEAPRLGNESIHQDASAGGLVWFTKLCSIALSSAGPRDASAGALSCRPHAQVAGRDPCLCSASMLPDSRCSC